MESENNKSVTSRLGYCEVCGSDEARYTCPRCELKTCSVNCIKIHKVELDCNGDRDKVGFVPLSKFNNLTLLSDYRLLEDINRTIDNCRRNPLKQYTRYNKPLPFHLYRLRREASKRKTSIQYLPQHFKRHKENTTFLHYETKIIYWKVELVFPQADNVKIVIEKCDENERLSTLLSKFIDFDKCPQVYRKSLKYYHSTGLSGLEVLLKAENVKTQPSFFLLDMSLTLKENFEDRIIIEYPFIYVIFKSHKDEYNILDPDMKIEFRKENNRGRKFLGFTPFSYFDTIQYSKTSTSGDKAYNSIKASVAELKKYFMADVDDEDEEEKKVKEIKNRNLFRRKRFRKRNNLNIPTYENLIKQNS